jgi:hypothetical protein
LKLPFSSHLAAANKESYAPPFCRCLAGSFHWLPVILLLTTIAELAAVEPTTDSIVADQLKQLNDLTIIRTHVSLDSEWDHYKDGAEKGVWTLSGLWAARVSDWQDWGIRLNLPVDYYRSDQASGHDEIGGIGDVELGVGTAFRLNHTWRTGGGLELHIDTASDPALGDKLWRLKMGWGVSHDVARWLTLTLSANYNHSVAEEDGARPNRYLELALPVTILLPQAWSMNAQYKTAIDFENGDRWNQRVRAGIAKRLSNVPIVISVGVEKPISGSAKRFDVDVTIVYYFQRYHRLR